MWQSCHAAHAPGSEAAKACDELSGYVDQLWRQVATALVLVSAVSGKTGCQVPIAHYSVHERHTLAAPGKNASSSVSSNITTIPAARHTSLLANNCLCV